MIFYILGSYDMHHENIISSGSTPVIVDFETLFNAQLSRIHEKSNFKDNANTVINSAFIPFVNERGAFDVNLSGILCKTEKSAKHKCLRLEGSNFRLGGIAPITRAVPSF